MLLIFHMRKMSNIFSILQKSFLALVAMIVLLLGFWQDLILKKLLG